MGIKAEAQDPMNHSSRQIPELYKDHSECCGCSACFSICPVNAISMEPDREGFLYPVIDEAKCITCGKCLLVCGFKKDIGEKTVSQTGECFHGKLDETLVYAVRTKDRNVLKNSSSGAAFSVISDYFLDRNWAIACCVYNYKENRAEFRILETKAERDQARGSKYMYSYLGDIFGQCMQWLAKNPEKQLMFIGMGCQAAGFCRYMDAMKMRRRVFVVDIICHGMPSPLMWKTYIEDLKRKAGSDIDSLNFRDKRNGWSDSTAVAIVKDKEVSLRGYLRLFYDSRSLRPACYQCPYTTTHRYTDMTIGDFWHIQERLPEFYDPMGNSLVLIHTEYGKTVFLEVRNNMEYCRSNLRDCIQYNLQYPTKEKAGREKFWKDYYRDQSKFLGKYVYPSLLRKIYNRILRKS